MYLITKRVNISSITHIHLQRWSQYLFYFTHVQRIRINHVIEEQRLEYWFSMKNLVVLLMSGSFGIVCFCSCCARHINPIRTGFFLPCLKKSLYDPCKISWLFLTTGCGQPYENFVPKKFSLRPLTALLGHPVQFCFLRLS